MKKLLVLLMVFFSVSTINAQDFGDFKSYELTSKAWNAAAANDHKLVMAYTNKCIEMYMAQAKQMQANLSELPKGSQEEISKLWALNDVGTCLFIQGESLIKNGDKPGAIKAFKTLTTELKFAQCWDVNGWFWQPAGAAKQKIVELEFDQEDF